MMLATFASLAWDGDGVDIGIDEQFLVNLVQNKFLNSVKFYHF